jgi:putative hydrolase of the HAD superfamily
VINIKEKDEIKLFVFDMGEVVIYNTRVLNKISDFLNISKEEFMTMALKSKIDLLQTGDIKTQEFWNNFSNISGIKIEGDPLEKFFRPRKNERIYELINFLKNKYRVVCGTNTIDSHYYYLQKADYYSVFDKVYASNLMGYSKPQEEFFNYILKEENVKPEEVVFIDDSIENINSARKIGLKTILFDDYKGLEEKFIEFELLKSTI